MSFLVFITNYVGSDLLHVDRSVVPLSSLLDRLEGLGDAYCSLLIRCLGVHIQGGALGGSATQVSPVIRVVINAIPLL